MKFRANLTCATATLINCFLILALAGFLYVKISPAIEEVGGDFFAYIITNNRKILPQIVIIEVTAFCNVVRNCEF